MKKSPEEVLLKLYFQVPGLNSLEAYAEAFNFVEVSSTFYEIQNPFTRKIVETSSSASSVFLKKQPKNYFWYPKIDPWGRAPSLF